jgi:hypothetical protein
MACEQTLAQLGRMSSGLCPTPRDLRACQAATMPLCDANQIMDGHSWRRGPESNRTCEALQASGCTLAHMAIVL